MRLSLEERAILLEALSRGPNPDHYDFGPAYEADKQAWQRLYNRVFGERSQLPGEESKG